MGREARVAGGLLTPDIWAALDGCRSVRIRLTSANLGGEGVGYVCRTCRQRVPKCTCTPEKRNLLEFKTCVWVHVRRRVGESLDAMLWRGLAELSRRQVDGMPGPNTAEKRRRDLRKLLLSADTKPC